MSPVGGGDPSEQVYTLRMSICCLVAGFHVGSQYSFLQYLEGELRDSQPGHIFWLRKDPRETGG